MTHCNRNENVATTALLLSGLLLASAAVAKPLYITVPRSYGSAESAVVDVAFASRQPVELRVLKPSDVDAFIESQTDLRRAYQEPRTQVNPGRYLTRGLNLLRSPAEYLLLAMDPELRSEIAEGLPERLATDHRSISRMREGPPKLVGIPAGHEVVRRRWLNLDLGGLQREFNVPGYTPEFVDSGFEERRVVLDPLPVGVYVLQLVQERIEGQVLLVITDLTVQVKQTNGKVLVRVAGRDLKPRSGVTVRSRGLGKGEVEASTDADGEAWLEVDTPRLVLSARQGADLALVDTDFYSSLAVTPDVFIYSDRPLYRPGDKAHFRGLLRRPEAFLSRLFQPRKRSVQVELRHGDRVVTRVRTRVDDFGSFAGSLKVPKGLDTGVLRLVAKLDDALHQAEARVQEYVKPTFYLEMETEQETARPGESLTVKVKARRYAGGHPDNTRYEVFLYRNPLSTPAWVDDSGLGGRGSAVTYGSVSSTEGRLNIPRRLYSSVAEREVMDDPWDSAELFDDSGEATVTVAVPELAPNEERLPFRYRLTVRARDEQGTFANSSKSFYFAQSEVMGALSPSAKVVLEDKAAQLAIKSVRLSGKALPGVSGEVSYVLRRADGVEKELERASFTTGDDAVWRGPLPTAKIGTVLARVTLHDPDGRPWQGETSMLVAGTDGEVVRQVPTLTVETLTSTLAPGDTAELVVLLPGGWGEGGGEKGSLWLTLEGRTLYETRRLELDGQTLVHRFEIERRFGSAVYASIAYPTPGGRWEERTTPLRIVPAERTLQVRLSSRQLEASPGGPQTLDLYVTDHRGRGVAAQVSLGVVDKAIYALQGEFRPHVLEFFYPLVRNNVASFYSGEFQGYGYGEVLARVQGLLGGQRFAAIKPPTRRRQNRDRDTAYWNADVRTDGTGHASVSFEMPGNQTLWVVTAVAADASGRFGETTAEFASRGALNLVAALPQYLRVGDSAEASLRVARGTRGKDQQVEVNVQVSGVLGSAQVDQKVVLPASGESLVSFPLEASAAGDGEVYLRARGKTGRVADRRSLPVLAAELEETVEVASYGGGELKLDLPEGARVVALELQLAPSTVAVALANLHELLEYPHGCLEQLVATTVPNIAVTRTLEQVGALDKLDPESQALLAEARSRAAQGVERILHLAVDGGGFTWFGGYDTPSLPLTMIALDGLAQAVAAGLAERRDPRITASLRWLEQQPELPFDLEATRVYVLAQLQGKAAAPRVRALLESAPAGDLYAIALAVLAAEQAGIQGEDKVQEQVALLVETSRAGIARFADWRPADPEVFWHYPLRRIGTAALLARAAALGPVDVDSMREGLMRLVAEAGELSTFERSMFLLHSQWLLKRDAVNMREMKPPVVESDAKTAVSLRPRAAGLAADLDLNTRRVQVPDFDGVATLRARLRVPVDKLAARSEGMQITRRYFVLTEQGPQPLEEGQAVTQGQEVYVQLEVDAHEDADARQRSQRSAYYVVEDALPAGFVPLLEDRRFEAAPYSLALRHEAMQRRSLGPERALFFFAEPTWWSRSPRQVGYVMRAQFAGRFVAPPARIQDMYAPRIRGRSAPATLTIAASGK